ncbi:hypothetical protein ACGF1Z_20050 [Streptomyces sp. NPDC048018]|uniref:hypothetical protein n=1 Tax=Streptomyces sp. NPDC048018 TaxID=3365499 RepID=UPI0037207453
MNALHQYMFDTYRAARHDEPPPPVPGALDVATLKAVRDHRRFEAVLTARPARGRLRAALMRRLHAGRCRHTP